MNRETSIGSIQKERRDIAEQFKGVIESHQEILFAYLHGSFVKEESFKDIDVAVYLKEMPESSLQYELNFETELMESVSKIIDVRVLNSSPLSFRFNTIRDSILLFVRDDDERVEFEETTIRDYLDFAPYRVRYLKETLGHGV